MAEFTYITVDKAGKIKRGVASSLSCSQLRKTMAAKGLELISCQEQSDQRVGLNLDVGDLFGFIFRRQITAMERISFAQHLAIMLKTGVPIIEGIDILALEATSVGFKKMIKALGNELEQGKNLSSFLEKRKFFSPAHLATLKAGEASGKVSEALVRISADLKRDHQMIKKIKGAMAYPLIITLALTGVTVFIVVFVLPKVGDVFKQMNLDIPLPTRILLALGSFLSHYYLYVIAGLGIAGLVLFSLSKTNVLSFKIFSQIVCYLPILKKLVYQVGMARFIRSLSSLLNSGVSIGDSLSISGEIFVSNKRKKIIKSVGEKVRGGVSLTEAFKTHQGSFGGMLVKMCSVGEKSGRLAEILEELAVFYEEEVQEKLDNFSTIIEPVLMLFVGVGVGAMILSIVGPIYQMMGSLTP